VEKALICLDVTPGIVDEAVREGAQLIIAHHPVIFHPLKALRTDSTHGALLADLLRREINVIALHTNADAARFGLNHALAEKLGMRETRTLDGARGHRRMLTLRMEKDGERAADAIALLAEMVGSPPVTHALDQGLLSVEADMPAWRVNTVRGRIDSLLGPIPHSWIEHRLEGALDGFGIGSIGSLPAEMPARAFLAMVKNALGCEVLRVSPFEENRRISRVAVCSGAGSSYVAAAVAAGADAIVTGDLTHHTFLDYQSDILLVDAGHYDTERLFIDHCAKELVNMVFENNEKIDILCTRTNTNPIWFV
ncbi:MAG: Nif3-like dinuclear metal center hexameric protein, partial [Bacteroidetes bacterium]|nr:Nif3-like dinuclear metal center hexameric protein [Bacteroidota bacterium]